MWHDRSISRKKSELAELLLKSYRLRIGFASTFSALTPEDRADMQPLPSFGERDLATTFPDQWIAVFRGINLAVSRAAACLISLRRFATLFFIDHPVPSLLQRSSLEE